MQTFHCPLCKAKVVHIERYNNNGTKHFFWSCPDCPFVGLEYYNDKDIDALREALNSDDLSTEE